MKIKRILNSRLFIFLLGAIIFGSISVYATTTILSKDISYTPENANWEVTNVEEAINDLYDKINNVYVFSSNNFGTSASGSVSGFKIGDYYFCVSNMRGSTTNFKITGADVIFSQINGIYFDYKYSNYRAYIKATSSTINFSYTATDGGNGNTSFNVVCYKFGTKS